MTQNATQKEPKPAEAKFQNRVTGLVLRGMSKPDATREAIKQFSDDYSDYLQEIGVVAKGRK